MKILGRDPKTECLTIKPLGYIGGLGRVGAYLSYINILSFGLLFLHKYWFERELYKEEIAKRKKRDKEEKFAKEHA